MEVTSTIWNCHSDNQTVVETHDWTFSLPAFLSCCQPPMVHPMQNMGTYWEVLWATSLKEPLSPCSKSLLVLLPFTRTRAQLRQLAVCCIFLDESFLEVLVHQLSVPLTVFQEWMTTCLLSMTSTISCFHWSTHVVRTLWVFNMISEWTQSKSVSLVYFLEIKKFLRILESGVSLGENAPQHSQTLTFSFPFLNLGRVLWNGEIIPTHRVCFKDERRKQPTPGFVNMKH